MPLTTGPEIRAEAEEAFEFAKQSPWPDPDTATTSAD